MAYRVQVETTDGRLIMKIGPLSDVGSSACVDAEVCERMLHCHIGTSSFEVALPSAVDVSTCTISFSRRSRVLTLRGSIAPSKQEEQAEINKENNCPEACEAAPASPQACPEHAGPPRNKDICSNSGDAAETVDLMSGQRTGGEHLPPLAAEATGKVINADGVAAFISHDGIAGSAPSCRAATTGSCKKSKKFTRKKVDKVAEACARSLSECKWAVLDSFAPTSSIHAVREEIKVMERNYEAGEIWVGKSAEVGAQIKKSNVRGDTVLWMGRNALDAKEFVKDGKRQKCCFHTLRALLQAIDQFVMGELSKPRLVVVQQGGMTNHRRVPDLLHLRERSDAMLAIYPGSGSRFARHIDNSAGDGRRLTVLCYLNPSWTVQQGGQLRVWPPSGSNPVDMYPFSGRLAMFYSKTVPHGVELTHDMRHSVTLWYYDSKERAEAIAAATIATAGMSTACDEDRMAARDFVERIMADGHECTPAGVAQLQAQAALLSAPAVGIISGIVSNGDAAHFQLAMNNLNTQTLAAMRETLGNMGLGQSHAPGV